MDRNHRVPADIVNVAFHGQVRVDDYTEIASTIRRLDLCVTYDERNWLRNIIAELRRHMDKLSFTVI